MTKYVLLLVAAKACGTTDKFYDVLYQALAELGGVYVKLVQFVCLRTEIFPNETKIKFLGFYDAVPVEPLDPKSVLVRELGAARAEKIAELEEKPFASGTFGQVYRGRVGNTPVVVKVKREGILTHLRADFWVLGILARAVDFIYDQEVFNFRELLAEFKEATYQELDYKAEAANGQYFYRLYRGHPKVVIPWTFTELTSVNVLVQEYIGGVGVSDLIRMRAGGWGERYGKWLMDEYKTDMKAVIPEVAYELCLQGFLHERFYADPHPGNIKILPNNRFALIDFGIVGKSPEDRSVYYNIISSVVKRAEEMDTEKVGEEFLKWGAGQFYQSAAKLDEYLSGGGERVVPELVRRYGQLLERKRVEFAEIEKNEKENFVQVLYDITKTGRFLGVRVPDRTMAGLKTIAVYKSWNSFLEPGFHHMRETYQRVLDSVDPGSLRPEARVEKEISLEEAVERFTDWVGELAEKDVPLYEKLAGSLEKMAYV